MSVLEQLIGEQPLFVWIVLGLAGFAIVWKGASILEDTTTKLGDHFNIPSAIQGGIIAAVATSFPELAVAVLSVLVLGQFGVGLGAIVGSAIFNVLVISGAASIVGEGTQLDRSVIYRDMLFFFAAIFALFGVLALGVVMTPAGTLDAHITPLMAGFLVLVYVVYVFLLSLAKRHEQSRVSWRVNVPKQVAILGVTLLLVLAGVEAMIQMTTEIAAAIGAPDFLVSVTLLAGMTSFPDLLVGMQLAEKGRGTAAISNVFGSNAFDMIGALPIGIILAGGVTVTFLQNVPLFLFLAFSVVATMVLSSTDFTLRAREGYILIGLYVLFVAWMVMEALGVTSVLTSGILT